MCITATTVIQGTGDGIKKFTPDGRTIRNGHKAGGIHDSGIPFDKHGYPDFSSVSQKDVQITQTGDNWKDFAAADKAAGIKAKFRQENNLTWHHHHQDGTTMQLVPKTIHAQTGHGPM